MNAKDKKVDDSTIEVNDAQFEEMKKMSVNLINGVPLYKNNNISKKGLDAMAAIAFNSYSSGQYDNALQIYKLLCLFDHTNSDYFLGSGICYQMKDQFGGAIEAYLTAIDLKKNSYNSYFNLAQCLLRIGNARVATETLEKLMEIAENEPAIKKTAVYKKAVPMLSALQSDG